MEVFVVCCEDGLERVCHIRGQMRRRVWVKIGNLVIVSLRTFEADKADIVHCYTDLEAATLRSEGRIPESLLTATIKEEGE